MNTQLRRLRPLGITDILDETVDLYRSNFALLVGSAAIVYVPVFLLTSFLNNPGASRSFDLYSAIIMIITLAAEAVVTGALTYGISDSYLGRKSSIASCYKRILRSKIFWPFIGIVLLKSLITAGPLQVIGVFAPSNPDPTLHGQDMMAYVINALVFGGLAFIFFIWFVYASIKLLFLESAFILEANGAFKSMKRSLHLTNGYYWKIFGVMLITLIVIGLVFGLIVGPVYGAYIGPEIMGQKGTTGLLVLATLLMTVFGTLLVPIPSIIAILLYYDIRVRKEGYDLELLAGELDHKTKEMSAHDITSLPQEKIPQPEPEQSTPVDGQQ